MHFARSTTRKVNSWVLLVLLLLIYGGLEPILSRHMKSRPIEEKLGVVPQVEVLKFSAADHKELTAASLVMAVLMYYGGLMEKNPNKLRLPADYPAMSRVIFSAAKIDPYNMDTYYFAQAILTWDVGKVSLANNLLEYGMKYRYWDWYLPYFAAFNYAYFFKDYEKAAFYYKQAGELSGEALFINLAGRYMHETGNTEQAIMYLSVMERSARNWAVKKSISLRLKALLEVRTIEKAVELFELEKKAKPKNIAELKASGYLKRNPVDPYGGVFYLDSSCMVRTTSSFALPRASESTSNGGDNGRH